MECLHVSSLLLLLGVCSCYLGSAKAEVTINVPMTILPGQPTSGSCVAIGNMYSDIPQYFYIRAKLVDSHNKGQCSITHIGRFQKLGHAQYQQKFNITCDNGNNSVRIRCFTSTNEQTKTQIHVQDIKPKITSKCSNITTEVGLPVTLTCYVEGDPNHYWVGWMSRHTVIQAGEEHSISTTPNFRSRNGTIHHLTIHTIKVSGKYVCKLYTLKGDVQDQVSHQIIVNEESHEENKSSSSSSFFNIFSSLFF